MLTLTIYLDGLGLGLLYILTLTIFTDTHHISKWVRVRVVVYPDTYHMIVLNREIVRFSGVDPVVHEIGGFPREGSFGFMRWKESHGCAPLPDTHHVLQMTPRFIRWSFMRWGVSHGCSRWRVNLTGDLRTQW